MYILTFPINLDLKIVDSGHTSATKSLIKQADGIRSVASKPFIGKVFYLDLPSNKRTETLENDITKLGGVRKKAYLHTYTKYIF